jgi:hypothetical protein
MNPASSTDQNLMKDVPYAHVIGHLIYLATTTFLNLSYPLGHCAQFMSNPGSKSLLLRESCASYNILDPHRIDLLIF